MKFNKAMEALQNGSKVTRQGWVGSIYFTLDGKEVKSYQPRLQPYAYDEDVMISDGWKVEGIEGEFKFYDIIDYLQQGLKAKIRDWKDSFIYFDRSAKYLVIHSMESFPYVIDFESFTAQDWVELP